MSQKTLKKGKPELTPVPFSDSLKMFQQLEKEGLISLAKPGDPDYEALKNDQSTTVVFSGRRT